MQIIKNELSAAARAGALDASLAFTTVHNEQRELVAQTAISGLMGLQAILSETGIYGAAIANLQEASDSIELANVEAQKDPILVGTSANQTTAQNAVNAGRQAQVNRLFPGITAAQTAANNALSGTANGTAEKTAATDVKNAAADVYAANQALYNGDASQVQSAYNKASAAKTAAQAAYDAAPTARKPAALAVLNAANQTLAAAQTVVDLRNSPTGQLIGVTPTTTNLGNGYLLSTWGSTGLVTLVSPDGSGGIIIKNDGSVDKLDETGKGWKFDNTSTFILPGDTKVTFNPGTPADLLVTRGIHAFKVENIRPGQAVDASDTTSLNGRVEDRASNDGHIITPRAGDSSAWQINGGLLGDAGSRETVATSAVTNELKLDPTDVAVSQDLLAFISSLGLTSTDYDGDGKLNNEELAELSLYVAKYVEQLQEAYNAALANVTQANGALFDLNEMLDVLRRENENKLDERSAESAENRAVLQSIERRLVSALQLLRGGETTEPASRLPGGIEASAERVLNQLTSFGQGGVQSLASAPAGSPPAVSPGTSSQPTAGSGSPTADPLGDSLRRASRLLSGLSSNLNILDLPPAAETAPAGEASPLLTSLNELATALAALPAQLGSETALNPEDLSAGLQGLLTALDEAGVLDLASLQGETGLEGLLQGLTQLLGGTLGSGLGSGPAADSLLSFLGTLAQFGSATQAVAPQAGQTTPGQVEQAGTGSLAPQSRTAEQLQLVLAGLASLGSAGAGQSTGNQGADAPTSAELRLGLQSFLAALAAFGVFGSNQAQDQNAALAGTGGISFQSGNTQQIATITGNFYTDPDLLKQIKSNLNKALQVQNDQLSRASTLFSQSQEIVQKFVSLVKEDGLVRELVQSDELSDEQQEMFDGKMTELRKDWGLEWGSDDNRAPASQSALVSRAVQSGMMV